MIGKSKFSYDVWGDAVNTASRMESHGLPNKVHCSKETRDLIYDDFEVVDSRPNGAKIEVKGKGWL